MNLVRKRRLKDVIEFVRLLGYKVSINYKSDELGKVTFLNWFDEKDYRSWSGVELSVYQDKSVVNVETSSPVGRSYFDLEHQNETIRLIRKHFGGSFRTDEGKGRYFRSIAPAPTFAASGCHLAFQRFGSNLITGKIYLSRRNFNGPAQRNKSTGFWLDKYNPEIISNNLVVPYITSVFEDFWKSTFIAILKYSERKDVVLKSGRLSSEQLSEISNGSVSVEQAYAETLSFQRISVVCRHFSALDPRLDFAGVLRKPYRRRKVLLFDSLEQMTDLRNEIIHRAEIYPEVTTEFINAQFHNLQVAVIGCYKHITQVYRWKYDKWWGAGN